MRLPVWAVLAASAAGCSLIIPLDYTGGTGGGAGTGQGGSSGGSTPKGGTSNGAEAGAGEGGNGDAGSVNGGGGSTGQSGSDTGGKGATGGVGGTAGGVGGTAMGGSSTGGVGGSSMGGEDPGGAPPEGGAGSGGGGSGGAGTTNGGAGSGGRGGRGGAGGAGMGGTGGCSFDLTSNPQHCGSCTNACPSGDVCIDSVCVSSPCDEIGCGAVQAAVMDPQGPRTDRVGVTTDVCVEVPAYTPHTGWMPAINCWNTGGRKVEVNKVVMSCTGDEPLAMPKRKGGYCFHAFNGGSVDTGFVMPYEPSGCCHP